MRHYASSPADSAARLHKTLSRTRGRIGRALFAALLLASASCAFVTGASQGSIAAPPPDLDAHPVMFMSRSGSLIQGWMARGSSGDGAVLLLHGAGATRESMSGRALFLHDEGFTVLALDFQGNGESVGDRVTYGARESLDAAAAVGFLRAVAPGERIGVIGVSMGGAAAVLGDAPIVANAFVLESVYPTIRQAVSNRLGTWLGPLGGVARLFTPAVVHRIGTETGVSESEMQPISHIASIRAPLLLIAGTADRYTPLAEAESLYAHASAPKVFWPVSGADHEDLYTYARADYEQRVGSFLKRYLRNSSAAFADDVTEVAPPNAVPRGADGFPPRLRKVESSRSP